MPKCRQHPCNPTAILRVEVKELRDMIYAQNQFLSKLLAKAGEETGLIMPPEAEDESTIVVNNPHYASLNPDILYHLALASNTHDFEKLFGDVKFVVMGGTANRIEKFAYYIMDEVGYTLHAGASLKNISECGNRYAMFKVGSVLCCSHGIGKPSLSIVMHEVIKLLHHAKCKDPVFFRLGTCGGIGVEPGTVVISEEAVDGQLRNTLEMTILGRSVNRSSKLNKELAEELKSLADPRDGFETIIARTMCTDDFYEGQARLDGAFCEYSEADKLKFLENLYNNGVLNIEMESSVFAAYTLAANIRSAVVCVTLLNRLEGDQISATKETLGEYEKRPSIILARYIRKIIHGEQEESPETTELPEKPKPEESATSERPPSTRASVTGSENE